MPHLYDAVSKLLDAHDSFLDAFEIAVVNALPPPDRRAVQGSANAEEGFQDRLPFLEIILTHAMQAAENILRQEIRDAGILAASASSAASVVAAAVSQMVCDGSIGQDPKTSTQ